MPRKRNNPFLVFISKFNYKDDVFYFIIQFFPKENLLHPIQKNNANNIFLKKTAILFVFSNKNVPLRPVNKNFIAAIAQSVEQRIRNA